MLKLPPWATDASVPLEERRSRAVEFVIRYIATFHNYQANLVQMSADVGLSPQAFYASCTRGFVTPAVGALLASAVTPPPLTFKEIMTMVGRNSIMPLTNAD